MNTPEWRDYNQQEQAQRITISYTMRKLADIIDTIPKITDDVVHRRNLLSDINNIKATLGMIERDMDREVKNRKINISI